ncbi:fumarylacetoacetate hydrolase family protein [Massilia cavernae]|uniref:2-oxopent-4-enoate hydratase n=1 Tax=Massilia cavernae TaxID=2320864 RepID=A0A418Y0Y1_9BURK|nr:fumarylacetoacetate hydrolase family protein [Massilia cavernae]RJG19040.1 2-oxopent-4-enoate hydratase [Massilia cavernae]
MQEDLVAALGDELFHAWRSGATLAPLTERHAAITLDDAYRISLHTLRRREAAGERVIGKKIGVTSEPVQKMLNVHQPDFGFLTDTMQYPDGASASVSLAAAGLIQPRAEGEIAFMLKHDLHGTAITLDDVLDATDWVAPCFEIVDSRVRNWEIRIQDTVADNASCGVFVVGASRTAPRALDLAAVRMDLYRNNTLTCSGLGSAVQGHPAAAVAWLANTLGRFGIPFRSGELILSGSLAALVPVSAGDAFSLQIHGLGGCSINFVE